MMESSSCAPVCPICLQPVRQSRSLSCRHVLCLPCLVNLSQSPSENRFLVTCPQCRQTTSIGDVNLGELEEKKPRVCANCKQDEAINDCGVCSLNLCQLCSMMHRRMETSKSHRLVVLPARTSGDDQAFCVDCLVPTTTTTGPPPQYHAQHGKTSLSAGSKLLLDMMHDLHLDSKEKVVRLEEQADLCRENIEQIDDRERAEVLKVRQHCGALVAQIQREEVQAIRTVEDSFGRSKSGPQDRERQLLARIQSLTRIHSFTGNDANRDEAMLLGAEFTVQLKQMKSELQCVDERITPFVRVPPPETSFVGETLRQIGQVLSFGRYVSSPPVKCGLFGLVYMQSFMSHVEREADWLDLLKLATKNCDITRIIQRSVIWRLSDGRRSDDRGKLDVDVIEGEGKVEVRMGKSCGWMGELAQKEMRDELSNVAIVVLVAGSLNEGSPSINGKLEDSIRSVVRKFKETCTEGSSAAAATAAPLGSPVSRVAIAKLR